MTTELGTPEEPLAVPLAELRPALEAVLMVADQPLDHLTLASAVGYPPAEVHQALAALATEYAEQGRGFDLRNVAGVGASTLVRNTHPSSNVSSSMGNRLGSPKPPWRRSRWWPTSNRSVARGCRRFAASTSTA